MLSEVAVSQSSLAIAHASDGRTGERMSEERTNRYSESRVRLIPSSLHPPTRKFYIVFRHEPTRRNAKYCGYKATRQERTCGRHQKGEPGGSRDDHACGLVVGVWLLQIRLCDFGVAVSVCVFMFVCVCACYFCVMVDNKAKRTGIKNELPKFLGCDSRQRLHGLRNAQTVERRRRLNNAKRDARSRPTCFFLSCTMLDFIQSFLSTTFLQNDKAKETETVGNAKHIYYRILCKSTNTLVRTELVSLDDCFSNSSTFLTTQAPAS